MRAAPLIPVPPSGLLYPAAMGTTRMPSTSTSTSTCFLPVGTFIGSVLLMPEVTMVTR